MSNYLLVFLLVLSTRGLLADDFKTTDGKEYKNVKVSRVEPDGIVLTSSSGISKVYFTELPKEVQERFHYDAAKAAAYSAEQNAALEQLRKQQEEAMRQRAAATAKSNEQLAKEQAGIEWTKGQGQNAQALQARYAELQQKEDDLLRRIGEIETLPEYLSQNTGSFGTRHRNYRVYNYKNPARADLPLLQSRLSDVRQEKDKVRQQLEQAQH